MTVDPDNLLQEKVSTFEIHDVSMETAIDQLSIIAQVPCCLETVARPAGKEEEKTFSLSLTGPTLKEALDHLCDCDDRYCWKADAGVINVYPQAEENNADYFMNRRLKPFDAVDTPRDQVISSLVGTLDPTGPVIVLVNLHGVIPEVSVSLKSATFRMALNEIARRQGNCFWILGRTNEANSLVFGSWAGTAQPTSIERDEDFE